MSIITIILFITYCFGLGHGLTIFVKKSDNILENIIMQFGIGLAAIPITLVIFNLLHIPIWWPYLLLLSLIGPTYTLSSRILFGKWRLGELDLKPKLKITKKTLYILGAVALFLLSFYVMHKGSFTYPWLEDGDPWDYTTAIQYVSEFKTYNPPTEMKELYAEKLINQERYISMYLPPYPPGYITLMAVLKQTNNSMNWTMKYFTSLIISLGILFFYFFAKRFTNNPKIALASAFVLAMVPSYLSHFTYSQALACTIIIPTLYCLEMIRFDKKWWILAGITGSGVLITQSSTAATFALLLFIPYFAIHLVQDVFYKPKEAA